MPGSFPLYLGCSPRRGGNSDTALSLAREALGGPPPLFLRDRTVLPCVSCGHCAGHKGECPLTERDGSAFLFDALQRAPVLILAAPIYFYHVPAQLKALMDRSQPWWMLRDAWREAPPVRKNAHVILLAARPKGPRLFEGALLSLKYWLDLFGFDIAGSLTLYGLDGPDDLRKNRALRLSVSRFAEEVLPRSETAPPPAGP